MSRFGLSERTAIEAGIYRRASFSQIAKEIGSTARSVSAEIRRNCTLWIADSLQNAHVNAFAGISFADRNVYFAEKSIAERSALPIPHSPVCVSNLLHMFAMSASCGEAVSVIAPTMLPHRHMLLL